MHVNSFISRREHSFKILFFVDDEFSVEEIIYGVSTVVLFVTSFLNSTKEITKKICKAVFVPKILGMVFLSFLVVSCTRTEFRLNTEQSDLAYNAEIKNEFYKVVLILDQSSSMADDLERLSKALEKVIDAASDSNVQFYVYNTDSGLRTALKKDFRLKFDNDWPGMVKELTEAEFFLKEGGSVIRPISNYKLADWTSYKYTFPLAPPLATFKINKDSKKEEIKEAKIKLKEVVTQISALGKQSDEAGICTLRRILAENGENKILSKGDKVNFILISDENNGGTKDSWCNSGGIITRIEGEYQDEWCISDFAGRASDKAKIGNASDCDSNGFTNESVAKEATAMQVAAVLGVTKKAVKYKYKNIDTIVSSVLERMVVSYEYENVGYNNVDCSEEDVEKIKSIIENKTGDRDNFIECVTSIYDDGHGIESVQIEKSSDLTSKEIELVAKTFAGVHCNENSTFFDSKTKTEYASYRDFVAKSIEKKHGVYPDPAKIEFGRGRCFQKTSIDHLGKGSMNPLAYKLTDNGTQEHTLFDDVKNLTGHLLGKNNYVVSSFHHNGDLNKGLCVINDQEATYGTNQDDLIAMLGKNGYAESICSPDYSSSLVKFAMSLTRDQYRTFVIPNYKKEAKVRSLLINGVEYAYYKDAYYITEGGKLIINEDYINYGDKVDISYTSSEAYK